jgi:uncharacterized damage-inducible protein DinB
MVIFNRLPWRERSQSTHPAYSTALREAVPICSLARNFIPRQRHRLCPQSILWPIYLQPAEISLWLLWVQEHGAVTTRLRQSETQLDRAAAQIFAANDRINQTLIEHIDPAAWRAKPPGNVRTIAAIFTHMHNVRCKWVRLTAPHVGAPPQLNRGQCTPQQVREALAESAACCAAMLAEILAGDGGRGMFRRDGWARPWPAGPEMLCYMLSHEAHHRGQVCMLAHQLGFPLPTEVASGIWNWEKLWKECGSSDGPGAPSPGGLPRNSREIQ